MRVLCGNLIVCDNEICIAWNKENYQKCVEIATYYTYLYVRKLQILDQLVICFIRFYTRLTTSDNAFVSFIARVVIYFTLTLYTKYVNLIQR